MVGYVGRRLMQALVTVVGVTVLVFLALHLTPGDPAAIIAGLQATEAEIDAVRQLYGLDEPLFKQYLTWMSRVVRGDFGVSYRGGRSIGPDLAAAYPVSLRLAGWAMVLAIGVGVPAGVLAAIRPNSMSDLLVMMLAIAGISLPGFWLALLLVLAFSLHLGWLPFAGWGRLEHYIMPTFVLSLPTLALMSRLTRAAMLDVLADDFIRTARAKGLAERHIRYGHALRNALVPIITVLGVRFGSLVGGAVVIETVFAIPGLGSLIVRAVTFRDFPLVQGGVLLIAISILLINLIVDLVIAALDPRIRYT